MIIVKSRYSLFFMNGKLRHSRVHAVSFDFNADRGNKKAIQYYYNKHKISYKLFLYEKYCNILCTSKQITK